MKTINIWFNTDATLENMWDVIVSLYDLTLYKDDAWHFFWEGPFIHIRCSEEFADEIVHLAEQCVVVSKVDEPADWADDHEIVDKYRWYFERQFHNNSVLAVQLFKDTGYPNFHELYCIFDRAAHCLCNGWFYIGKEAAKENRLSNLELAIVSHYAAQRARFFGKWEYAQELYNEHLKRASEEDTD